MSSAKSESESALWTPRMQLWQLMGLSVLGVTLPLIGRLADNSQYLILEDYSLIEVVSVAFLLFPILPLMLWLIVRLLVRLGCRRSGDRVFSGLIVLLSAMCGMTVVRAISVGLDLQRNGIPEVLPALVALAAAAAVGRLNRRSAAVRQFLCVLAWGGLAVPYVLFGSAGVRWQLLGVPDQSSTAGLQLPRPVPIVMVVFDGLNGMSLLNAEGQIDRHRFPSFAALADSATMYRNATTVHPRTDHALPAMLTGTLPREEQFPVEADYPPGLFRRIFESGQYDMTVFEPLTRFCPTELRQLQHGRSAVQQIGRLLSTLLRVNTQICLPLELAPEQTIIPREWFGLLPHNKSSAVTQKGLVIYGWDTGRREQVQHFIKCLTPGSRPGFAFLHIALPHYPWSVLPSGAQCFPMADVSIATAGLRNETWTTDEWLVQQAWDRNLLQALYADRCLGMITETLRQQQTLEQTLLIVTADHGMCFMPGASLRETVSATLPDLLPVPLLIHLPGQTQSTVTDRNVEIIDILPTIADVTGMESSPDWDGSSLLSEETRARKTLCGNQPSILAPDFPQRFQHVQRLISVFGEGGVGDRIGRLDAVPGLRGRRVEEFAVGVSALRAVLASGVVGRGVVPGPFSPGQPYTACLQHGRIERAGGGEGAVPGNFAELEPVWLAIAVSGRIVATTRTSTDAAWRDIFTAYVPEDEVPVLAEQVQLYEIPNGADVGELRRVAYRSVSIDEVQGLFSGAGYSEE